MTLSLHTEAQHFQPFWDQAGLVLDPAAAVPVHLAHLSAPPRVQAEGQLRYVPADDRHRLLVLLHQQVGQKEKKRIGN